MLGQRLLYAKKLGLLVYTVTYLVIGVSQTVFSSVLAPSLFCFFFLANGGYSLSIYVFLGFGLVKSPLTKKKKMPKAHGPWLQQATTYYTIKKIGTTVRL